MGVLRIFRCMQRCHTGQTGGTGKYGVPGYELSKLTGSQLPEMTTATRGPDVANNVRCSNKQLTAVVYVLRTLYYVCLRWQLEEGMTASIPEITAASDLASIPDIDDP